jgi:hypothetical protein
MPINAQWPVLGSLSRSSGFRTKIARKGFRWIYRTARLRFLKKIAETIQKAFPVPIVAKNLPSGNPSGDHMMQRTRGIYPSLAGHTSTCIKIQPAKQVQRPRMILFPLLSRAISRASFEVKSVPLFRPEKCTLAPAAEKNLLVGRNRSCVEIQISSQGKFLSFCDG